jgi:YgiT-type zinc finger domain-containing protein
MDAAGRLNIVTCPACGRRTLKRVRSDVTLGARPRRFTFREVPHFFCSACGERLFDRESNQAIDAQRKLRRRRVA